GPALDRGPPGLTPPPEPPPTVAPPLQIAAALPTALPHTSTGALTGALTALPPAIEPRPEVIWVAPGPDPPEPLTLAPPWQSPSALPTRPTALPQTSTGALMGALTALPPRSELS